MHILLLIKFVHYTKISLPKCVKKVYRTSFLGFNFLQQKSYNLKRIALVISSLTSGGAERVMSELANYFVNKPDVEIHLIILIRKEKFFEIDKRVKIYEPDFDYKKYSRPIFTLKILKYLRSTLKLIRPDTCLSFSGRYNSFALIAAYGLGLKVFISDRSRPGISYGKLLDFINPILYKTATGIIAQTSKAKDFAYQQTHHKNIRVINNPIRTLKKVNVERQNIILNVGRFIPSKKQELLIEIFSRIKAPEWKLQFLGDGERYEAAKKKAEKLGVADRVLFEGMQRNIDKYYFGAKIFAFTSVSEGFPNALGEATAAGLASISFDCNAGPSDLIDDGKTGFLIPMNQEEVYENRLQELIDNATKRTDFGKYAEIKAERFSLDYIANQYFDFILSTPIL